MKGILLPAAAMVAGSLAMAPAFAQPREYVLDPEHLVVAFLVDHAGFARVLGRFTSVQGEFSYDSDTRELSAGHVRIGSNSVASDDRRRDRHVRGGDFLDARSHPLIEFRAGELRLDAIGRGELEGRLTIRGTTRPITLQARLNQEAQSPFTDDTVLGGSLRGTLSRSDFGIDYGLEQGWVGDEVELIIEFEAIRQE